MTFKVSWDEGRSGERRVRRCETADETRGFIRGLRIHPDHTNITVRRIAEDGQLVKMKVAELFDSPAEATEPLAVPAPVPVEQQAPAVEAQEAAEAQQTGAADTLAALATALVEEVEITHPIAAALAVVAEEPAAEMESVVAEAAAPANDPHPALQPAPRPSSASQAASMLRMAERWM